MSKYNLLDIYEGMTDAEYAEANEKDRLEKHPDKDKIKKMQALMRKERRDKENEAVDLAVEASQKKAGIKEGNTDADQNIISSILELIRHNIDPRDAMEEIGQEFGITFEFGSFRDDVNEARVDRDVAERIEGLLHQPMKRAFLDKFEDLYLNLVDEWPIDAEDVINHLNNEMHRRIDGVFTEGDKQADDFVDEIGEGAMQPGEADLEAGVKGNMDAYTEDMDDKNDPSVKALLKKIANHLKASDRNFLPHEIKEYLASLLRDLKRGEFDGVETLSMEDHEEDLGNMISDKALQEHFGRFMKDHQ